MGFSFIVVRITTSFEFARKSFQFMNRWLQGMRIRRMRMANAITFFAGYEQCDFRNDENARLCIW